MSAPFDIGFPANAGFGALILRPQDLQTFGAVEETADTAQLATYRCRTAAVKVHDSSLSDYARTRSETAQRY